MENNAVFVLLAGGQSSRMGVDKGLLKYKHTFWVLEQLNRISKSEVHTVYIGLGYNCKNYFDAIPWLFQAQKEFVNFMGLKIQVIVNPTPELGSFSTLVATLKHINQEFSILINPIDTPILNPSELNKLNSTDNRIVLPFYKNKNGHPIKLSNLIWTSFLDIPLNDESARLDRQIKNSDPNFITQIEVFDPSVSMNLNTVNEWKKFVNSY